MGKLRLVIFSCLIAVSSFAQTNLDSLWGVWNNVNENDSIRINALLWYSSELIYSNPDSVVQLTYLMEDFSIANEMRDFEARSALFRAAAYYFQGLSDSALKYYGKSLKKSKEYDIRWMISESHNGLGLVYSEIENYEKSVENYAEALTIAVEDKDTVGMANLYSNIAVTYHLQGRKKMALEYYFKALKLNEKSGNSKANIGRVLSNISNVYRDIGDLEKAQHYNKKAIVNHLEVNDLDGLSVCYFDEGAMYEDQKKYKEGLKKYLKALDYAIKIGDKAQISSIYYNIVNVYLKIEDQETSPLVLDNAFLVEELELSENFLKVVQNYSLQEMLEKSIKYSIESGDNYNLAYSYLVMGKLKHKQNKYNDGTLFLLKAYDVAQNIASPTHKIESKVAVTEELYLMYKAQKNYKASIAMYEEYIILKDSLDSEEAKRELYNQEYKYNYEKKVAIDSIKHEKAQKIKQIEIEKQKVELRHQKNRQLLLYGGLGIALLFSIYFVKKNKEVREQKKEVEKQKDFAEEQQKIAEQQKEILGKQHREIRDSINYAQSLQRSVLPSKEAVYQNFSNSFVLLKPKDVVSGDFYWTYKKGDLVYLAVVDCTGHGVPGAFMTIVANNLLNEIIQEDYNTPKEIVEELHQRIKLRVGGSPTAQVRDSMDLGLFSYNEQTQEVRFVGTHTSIYRVRNSKLEKFKGSKADIGYKPSIAIEEQVFQVETNDMLYMHSDGYPDQKGGPKGKKFYYQPIRTKLEEISLLNLMEQEQIMNQTFEDWKGEIEQLDDVCMLGVRL